MISKVFQLPHIRARKKNKSIFLGRQWEGGGIWVSQPDAFCFTWPRILQFFIQHGHLLVSLLLKILQDLLTYEPHVLFARFLLIPGAIGERKKKKMENRRQCLHRP